MHVEQAAADHLKRIGMGHFRDQDGVRHGLRGSGQIVGVPRARLMAEIDRTLRSKIAAAAGSGPLAGGSA